jgi:hypothetical protein
MSALRPSACGLRLPFVARAIHPEAAPTDGVGFDVIRETLQLGTAVQGRLGLLLQEATVATFRPDMETVTLLEATTGRGSSALDLLGAIALQRPSGLIVIEGHQRRGGGAFFVEHGVAVSAFTCSTRQRIETWLPELNRKFPDRFDASGHERIGAARRFIEEAVIEAFLVAHDLGSRMVMIRGDVEWLGSRLPSKQAPGMEQLLLETTRRIDEMPTMMLDVGSLDRVLVRGSTPQRTVDPDGRTSDACDLWTMIDNARTAHEVLQESMLGQFRGLDALARLLREGHACWRTEAASAPAESRPSAERGGSYSFVRTSSGPGRAERVDVRRVVQAPRHNPLDDD